MFQHTANFYLSHYCEKSQQVVYLDDLAHVTELTLAQPEIYDFWLGNSKLQIPNYKQILMTEIQNYKPVFRN